MDEFRVEIRPPKCHFRGRGVGSARGTDREHGGQMDRPEWIVPEGGDIFGRVRSSLRDWGVVEWMVRGFHPGLFSRASSGSGLRRGWGLAFPPKQSLDGAPRDVVDVEALKAIPGVQSHRVDEGVHQLSVSELHTTVPRIFAAIEAQGLHLSEFKTHSATLEDVFVRLTGRNLRDE
jgi:Domain of unknown function (DUF4162)